MRQPRREADSRVQCTHGIQLIGKAGWRLTRAQGSFGDLRTTKRVLIGRRVAARDQRARNFQRLLNFSSIAAEPC